jgi:hypothetical protein
MVNDAQHQKPYSENLFLQKATMIRHHGHATTRIGNSFNKRRSAGSSSLVYTAILVVFVCVVGAVCAWYFVTIHVYQNHIQPTHAHLEQLKFEKQQQQAVHLGEKKQTTVLVQPSSTTVESVRKEFQQRYGMEYSTKMMSDEAVHRYGSIQATAERLLRAAASTRPFEMAFGGYSVTVGRGNHYQQSYPFVLQRILRPLFQSQLGGLSLRVTNAAIGGIPSFPYGFCFSHFFGSSADVVSWDYSMNEGKGAAVFESYLRHSQHQLSKQPMMIVLDRNPARCNALRDYTVERFIQDGLCVGMAKDVLEPAVLTELNAEDTGKSKYPAGLQNWSEFGAPASCPGRGNWHPKYQEHAMIGWMMAMYFVDAVEVASKIMKDDPVAWKAKYSGKQMQNQPLLFPTKLLSGVEPPNNSPDVTELLFGHAVNGTMSQLKDVACRTNFLPSADTDRVLPSIIVDGWDSDTTEESIMTPRTEEQYQHGWVLDVSNVERDTKVKVEQCGGLGYIDMKIALYGIPQSGTLRLWLPFEAINHDHDDHSHHQEGDDDARHWFDNIIICEANEKRGPKACRLDSDLQYTVGGIMVPGSETPMIKGAGEYLKRQTCVHVGVPEGAKMTKLKDVTDVRTGQPLDDVHKQRLLAGLPDPEHANDSQIGLVVDIVAKSPVTRANGACCISHVVWEQH